MKDNFAPISISPYGNQGILINWPQIIDPKVNAAVLAMSSFVKQHYKEAVLSTIPAYCSLVIQYDPSVISFSELKQGLQSWRYEEAIKEKKNSTIIKIPVCFDLDFGPDMRLVCDHTGLNSADVKSLFLKETYHIYMLGFLPGFPYMGRLPERLDCPRKIVPVKHVVAGSVGLAGRQTGIYPSDAPGGWQIIGRTPLRLFRREKPSPFLLQPGDSVQFYEIDAIEFDQVKKEGL